MRRNANVHFRICRNVNSWLVGNLLPIVFDHGHSVGVCRWRHYQLGELKLGMPRCSSRLYHWNVFCSGKSNVAIEKCKLHSSLASNCNNLEVNLLLILLRAESSRRCGSFDKMVLGSLR